MREREKVGEENYYLRSLIDHPGIETAPDARIFSLERHCKGLGNSANTAKELKTLAKTDITWRISLKKRGTGGWYS